VIFFTVWYVVVLWPKAHPVVNLPYTAFVAQVRSGNVANVHIVGGCNHGTRLRRIN
jgi:hypothetical protein